MESMKLYIKNMVCDRCILVIKSILAELDLPYSNIKLGEVELTRDMSPQEYTNLSTRLTAIGFDLIDDRRTRLIERIKTIIVEVVYNRIVLKSNLSDYISDQLHLDYKYLSNIFSETEGVTIEKYLINQKIERAKELLEYDEMSLSQIAFELNYSSTAHLSTQFKKQTGLTPTQFKEKGQKDRLPIDKL